MRQCAYLTMHSLEDFECYDSLTFAPLQSRGWQASEIPWRDQNVDWNEFEVVVIRSPWDYQNAPDEFLSVLEEIEASNARLLNPLEVVRWNISKRYLEDFAAKGVPIVPTRWMNAYDHKVVSGAFNQWHVDEIIIKPQVSANADDTFRLDQEQLAAQKNDLQVCFAERAHMLQPFIPAIVEEGEYSLFYFNGVLSHTIIKRPKDNDFRVQEEHGGQLELIEVTDELLQYGDAVIASLDDTLLYARVDLVRHENQMVLMELEAIEPSLYFNMDDAAADRFANAFVEHMNTKEN